MRDVRYQIIKPKFDEGKIKRFKDILLDVPKTLIAKDIGKSGAHFNKVIGEVALFRIKELAKIGQLCDLSLSEMIKIISADCVMPKPKDKDDRYENTYLMFKTGKIKSFEEIFQFIPKSIVASHMRTKSDRLGRLINKVEDFVIKEVLLIGSLCYLNKDQTLSLILVAYEDQNSKKSKKS